MMKMKNNNTEITTAYLQMLGSRLSAGKRDLIEKKARHSLLKLFLLK